MREALLAWLRCPLCGDVFRLPQDGQTGGEVAEGILADGSGHWFPILDGIPRVFPGAPVEFHESLKRSMPGGVPTAPRDTGQPRETVASFGFQWTRETRPRSASDLEYRVLTKCGVDRSFFHCKLVLDAGCGAGLQACFMASLGATVVALDLSDAVSAAVANARDLPSVHVVQGDLTRPPFAPGTFDFVYSEGVLHHTPDPATSFRTLARLVKPGGHIAAGFYGRRERGVTPFLVLRTPLRAVVSRLPRRLVWWLTALSMPLNAIPVLNRVLRKTVLVYDPRNPGARATWCTNYDFYGPHRYQHYLKPSEIAALWHDPALALVEHVEGAGGFRRARRVA
jgi:SAM-dependent methyltransferase/uncharacterized protein YbaR (Trm112 family)